MNQKTIKSPFKIEGIGLHTGTTVRMQCLPETANKGIYFVRTDLEKAIEIPASIINVDSTYRSTTLKKGDVFVHTTEHLLSALFGLGIDNMRIELDGPEIPILDGSANPFVKALLEAGLQDLEEEQELIDIPKQVHFKDEASGAEYFYFPVDDHDNSEITSIIE
jgi:UDP-3-O-acyl-N-acetylglucosamine deacetylase